VRELLSPALTDSTGDTLLDEVEGVLEALIACGDLVETVEEVSTMRRRVIYLGTPRFVRRRNGDVLLVGTRPDAQPIVGEALSDRIEWIGHLRRVAGSTELEEMVADYGLIEIDETRWIHHPTPETADEYLKSFADRLSAAPPSGEIPDLRILDRNQPTSYYRGRWRPSRSSDVGTFVARRSQGYGADLWCFVELDSGEPLRLLDLPSNPRERGCDEAWRLQAAIDALRGVPQVLTALRTGRGAVTLGLSAPPPRWLQRRWDLLGTPSRAKGCLFAYDFSTRDVAEEVAFAREMLWMDLVVA
jgi:hypothetical protein